MKYSGIDLHSINSVVTVAGEKDRALAGYRRPSGIRPGSNSNFHHLLIPADAAQPKQVHRPETWMERLIAAEQTERQLKSLRYQLKAARFPIHRDLLGIDWTETPLSQAVVEQLKSAAFIWKPRTT